MSVLKLAIPGVSPSWSPDGNLLAYVRVDYPIKEGDVHPDYSIGTSDVICTSNVNGAGFRLINIGYWPTWGLDSRTLYNVMWGRVFKTTLGSSSQIIVDKEYGSFYRPHLAPNGRQLAFVDSTGNEKSLYVVNTDGSDLRCLCSDVSSVIMSEPSWSHDGTKIVVGFRSSINVIDVSSGNISEVADLGYYPIWNPTQPIIASCMPDVGSQEEKNGIYLFDTRTKTATLFPCNVMYKKQPMSWSPNGRYIAFTRVHSSIFHRPKYQVCLLDVKRRTFLDIYEESLESDSPLAWSPDSTMVAISTPPDYLIRVLDLSEEQRKQW
jgi:Tol biopolymer transport system component